MFSTDILDLENKLNMDKTNFYGTELNDKSTMFDLQYQLYSKYLQMSKQQFAVQELIAMKDMQCLIQSIASNNKIQLGRDASSTMDSFSYDQDMENSIMQDISTIQRRSAKKITRKGTRHSVLKPMGRSNQEFQQILEQIQRNCSERAHHVVKTLLDQHKKNLSKIIEIQKKEKSMKKIQQSFQKMQQQNILYKNKLSQIEQKIKLKDDEIKMMKQKIQNIKITEKENIFSLSASKSNNNNNNSSSGKPLSVIITKQNNQQQTSCTCSCNKTSSFQSESYSEKHQSLIAYLSQKQDQNNKRLQKIQNIELKIQDQIQRAVLEYNQSSNNIYGNQTNSKCPDNRCCFMIKKIKQSVQQYRKYLQEQAQQEQKVYNMLRERVLKEEAVQVV